MFQVVGEPQVIPPFPWIFLQDILAGNLLSHFFSPQEGVGEGSKVLHLMPIPVPETGTAPSPAN